MNRAIEFLNEAYGLLGYYGNDDQARLLVRLAVGEVQELLDRMALYEATNYALEQRQQTRSVTTPNDGGVLVVEAQPLTPARLAERPRAALPGNGKGL